MKEYFLKTKVPIFLLFFLFLIIPQLVSADVPSVSSLIGGDPVATKVGCNGGNCGLGGLISNILSIVFGIAGIIAFVWGLIGVVQYILAGGNKEGLAKARGRITWAFIGLLFLIISYSLSLYIREVLQFADPSIPPISQ